MRRLAVVAALLVAFAAPAAASLKSVCNKGGVEVPLFPVQALRAFQNCLPGLKPGPPEEQLAVFADEQGIYLCLCYAGYLRAKAIEQNKPSQEIYSQHIAQLQTLLAYYQQQNAAGPVSCNLTVTPSSLTIPGDGQRVTVVGQVPPGTSTVTVNASRNDASFTSQRMAMPDAKGRFTVSYTFNVGAGEGGDGVRFFYEEPFCEKQARVKFRRSAPAVALLAKPNPLIIEPGGQASLTLLLIGTGDVQWTALADGASVLGPQTSAHQPKLRLIPFTLPPDTTGTITVRVRFPDGSELPTNGVRVATRPRAASPPVVANDPLCVGTGGTARIFFRAENPGMVPIEVRAAIKGKAGASPIVESTGTGTSFTIDFPLPPISPPGAKFRLYLKARYLDGDTKVIFYDNTGIPAGAGRPPTLTVRRSAGPIVGALVPRGAGDDECELCECDLGDPDDDVDGVGNPDDNCPDVANADQADAEGDGIGNACDNCPEQPNDDQLDLDADGAGDACDSCPDDANPGGADGDGDGIGDVCDVCPVDLDAEQADTDGDGPGDVCDNCPETSNADQADDDTDGVGNACADELCEPATCCPEFPEACDTECYEPCPPDTAVDPADCSACVDAADLDPPAVQIQAPAAGSSVPAGATVQVTTLFADGGPLDTGVVSGTFSASGPAVASGASPPSFAIAATAQKTQLFAFTVKSDLTGITDRTIVVTAQGTDAAGNVSSVATVNVVASGTGLSVLLSVSPSDPGPGQAVTVTITVPNCAPSVTQVHYTVAGTDGYAAENTLAVDGACQASFGIPGGATGVVDVVSVDIVGSGVAQTVSYSF